MKRFLVILGIFVVSIAVLVVLANVFAPPPPPAQVFTPPPSKLTARDVCAYNLRQLGHVFAAYRENNDGMFPFDPEEHDPTCSLLLLYPSYISLQALICPADEKRQSVQCEKAKVESAVISYRYCPPLTGDPPGDAILIYDRYPKIHDNGASLFRRRYGRNVLLVNGTVIWLEEDKFLEARNMGRVPKDWWKLNSGERVPGWSSHTSSD